MLRLLQSIFGKDKQGCYPESLIKEAIERTVEGTDPWLRAVSGYRKKLRPAVIRAIDYVVTLVEALPPPVPMLLASYGEDRLLRSFFISATEMKQILAGDRILAAVSQGAATGSRIFALLAMEKQEKVAFGAGLSGDVVIRDVARVTVTFAAHRFLDPTGDETETRRMLKRRAFDHLLGLALKRLTGMKSDREDLENRRTLLRAKLNLLEREGWGFDKVSVDGEDDIAAVEEQLGEIELQLLDLGGDYHMLDAYLATVAEVVGRPGEYLRAQCETIFVDRMGFKHQEAADDAPELPLNMLYNAEGRSLAVMLVALEVDELRGLTA